MISVLFVCFGNICRSPALQACLQNLLKNKNISNSFHVESCGVGGHFVGSPVDSRMKKMAEKRGLVLEHTAIVFQDVFYLDYDYIFVVTKEIKQYLEEGAPDQASRGKIYLSTHFSKRFKDHDLPDPYYGGEGRFDLVFDMIEDSVEGILEFLEQKKTT